MKRLFPVLIVIFAALLLTGCHTNSRTGYERRYLNSQYGCIYNEWTVSLPSESPLSPHPATVPGNIHDDLLANKLIPDPFYGDNESKVQWVSDSVWEYIVHFDRNCGHGKSFVHNELVFEGLDTYAEVYINGQRLVATTGDWTRLATNCASVSCLPRRSTASQLPNCRTNSLIIGCLPARHSMKAAGIGVRSSILAAFGRMYILSLGTT